MQSAAPPQHEGDRHGADGFNHREERRLVAVRSMGGFIVRGVEPPKLFERRVLPGRDLNHGHARDRLLEVAVDACHPRANLAVGSPGRPPEEVDAEDHDGQQRHAHEGKLPVDPQHEPHDAEQLQEVENNRHRPGGEHLVEHVNVARDARHDAPDGGPIEETHG